MKLGVIGWLVVVVVSACAYDEGEQEPMESTVESASTSSQGSRYQGTDYQGSRYQGSRYQGSRYQGSRYQGATYGATTATNAAVINTALIVWTRRGSNWEQRFPNKICIWNSSRTVRLSCSTVNLTTTPSPLSGVEFPAEFLAPDGTTIIGAIRIGANATSVGAVKPDDSIAMHPLTGNGSTCALVAWNAKSPTGEVCDNPNGCRVNCDLWTYDVRIADAVDSSNTPLTFCPAGEVSIALAGTWNATGAFVNDSTRFTFSCSNGTITKCTRWGYRPFGAAYKSDNIAVNLAPYHAACVRAATADYCANGNSFTYDGTLVDVYDYKSGGAGLIPRTRNNVVADWDATAFVWESTFDANGAKWIDHARYEELSTITDPVKGCPGRFYLDGANDDAVATYSRCQGPSATCSSGAPWSVPAVSVDSTPACAHSEKMVGKWLHESCSSCTSAVRYADSTSGYPYAHCTDPRGGGWDATCVAKAAQICGSNGVMTPHNECTTGVKLGKFSTGCALKVCLDPAYEGCCTGSWDASCTAAANSKCTGGQEGFVFVWNALLRRYTPRPVGFCGL